MTHDGPRPNSEGTPGGGGAHRGRLTEEPFAALNSESAPVERRPLSWPVVRESVGNVFILNVMPSRVDVSVSTYDLYADGRPCVSPSPTRTMIRFGTSACVRAAAAR